MRRNDYLSGMLGLITGDALGVPYEFSPRERLKHDPACDMTGFGTYDVPAGTWSDDSSMALATLDSLKMGYRPRDIMQKFADWLTKNSYTPYGEVFDCGITCRTAIERFIADGEIASCGLRGSQDNGNGSLMRILPACIYFAKQEQRGILTEEQAVSSIHQLSALTHAHLRSMIACGLYYFLTREIITGKGTLKELLQRGFDKGFAFYEKDRDNDEELKYYECLRDMNEFELLPDSNIISSGYVVASFEAAIWSLLRSDDYKSCVLTAVNLGSDTDTVAAIAGGLAGLYYGYENMPMHWLEKIARREWIEGLIKEME